MRPWLSRPGLPRQWLSRKGLSRSRSHVYGLRGKSRAVYTGIRPQRFFLPCRGFQGLLGTDIYAAMAGLVAAGSTACWEDRAGDRVMTAKTRFRGSFTALVTPFKNGSVDEKAFRELVEWQIAEGTNGLVPVGTTGESPTLSHQEHGDVVEWCVDQARGRVPVIAGAGSNSTKEAVSLAQHAEKVGADAVLVVTPYYNKPTQEGLYQHFKAINDAVGIPILIYNIPGRSVVDMSVDTMKRLYELDNIVGVKDATGDLARVSRQRHALGADFIQLSGEDMTALCYMA